MEAECSIAKNMRFIFYPTPYLRGKLNSFPTRVAFGLIQLLGATCENSWMDARRNIPRTQQRSIFLTKRVTCGCGRRKELLELRRLPWRTDRNPVALHCYFYFIQRPALMRWEWTSARAGGLKEQNRRSKAQELLSSFLCMRSPSSRTFRHRCILHARCFLCTFTLMHSHTHWRREICFLSIDWTHSAKKGLSHEWLICNDMRRSLQIFA